MTSNTVFMIFRFSNELFAKLGWGAKINCQYCIKNDRKCIISSGKINLFSNLVTINHVKHDETPDPDFTFICVFYFIST